MSMTHSCSCAWRRRSGFGCGHAGADAGAELATLETDETDSGLLGANERRVAQSVRQSVGHSCTPRLTAPAAENVELMRRRIPRSEGTGTGRVVGRVACEDGVMVDSEEREERFEVEDGRRNAPALALDSTRMPSSSHSALGRGVRVRERSSTACSSRAIVVGC